MASKNGCTHNSSFEFDTYGSNVIPVNNSSCQLHTEFLDFLNGRYHRSRGPRNARRNCRRPLHADMQSVAQFSPKLWEVPLLTSPSGKQKLLRDSECFSMLLDHQNYRLFTLLWYHLQVCHIAIENKTGSSWLKPNSASTLNCPETSKITKAPNL
jgi:hypothetical protein